MKQTLRSAGLGKIIYQCWFKPVGQMRDIVAAGGPLEVRRTELGRREMEAAAYTLPLLPATNDSMPLELHLLTGKKFWYQTAFCLWTFARQSGHELKPCIYDDSTLAPEHREPIARLFPKTRFFSHQEISARLDAFLPRGHYPTLRSRGDNFPLLHKLTDPHVGSTGWKLLIDSDLLFFRRPEFLTDWLIQPSRPLHSVDCISSLGYPVPFLNELAGNPVYCLLNTGLLGLQSDEIDWARLEFWCHKLQERMGTHYYQEQALVAMLLAGRDCAIAPAADYVTKPAETEALRPHGVMHHYVSDAKKWYFRHCWRAASQP